MILLLAAALVLAGGRAPQQTAESRTALVTVSDARNRLIVDLGPDDFVITERGEAREILDARMADYPIAVLVDAGSAGRADFDDIRKAVARFVARVGQRPIAVGTLADPPAAIAAFDDDRVSVAARVAEMKAASGDTVALEAVAGAARALRDAGSRFSAIVIVCASDVDASRLPPEELIPPIMDSGAVVHAIVNRASATTPIAGPMEAVRRLADQTHGQFMPIYSVASYQVALDRLADRLASEMVVEYIVPPRSAATDIQVGVRIPGARVRGLGVRPR